MCFEHEARVVGVGRDATYRRFGAREVEILLGLDGEFDVFVLHVAGSTTAASSASSGAALSSCIVCHGMVVVKKEKEEEDLKRGVILGNCNCCPSRLDDGDRGFVLVVFCHFSVGRTRYTWQFWREVRDQR